MYSLLAGTASHVIRQLRLHRILRRSVTAYRKSWWLNMDNGYSYGKLSGAKLVLYETFYCSSNDLSTLNLSENYGLFPYSIRVVAADCCICLISSEDLSAHAVQLMTSGTVSVCPWLSDLSVRAQSVPAVCA